MISHYRYILLVEDNPDDREFITKAIEEIDSEVHIATADNGLHALQILPTLGTAPDLILLDRNMPVMNGREFLLNLRRGPGYLRFQNIPVVMLTNAIHIGTEKFEQDISLYVTKPASPDLFRQMLGAILQHDVVQDSALLRRRFPLAWTSGI